SGWMLGGWVDEVNNVGLGALLHHKVVRSMLSGNSLTLAGLLRRLPLPFRELARDAAEELFGAGGLVGWGAVRAAAGDPELLGVLFPAQDEEPNGAWLQDLSPDVVAQLLGQAKVREVLSRSRWARDWLVAKHRAVLAGLKGAALLKLYFSPDSDR